MNEILLKVQSYLEGANLGAPGMSESILDEAAAAFRASLDKTFNQTRDKEFTVRMSNVGRPLCQLQMEQVGTPAEPAGYDFRMKMIIGDLIDVIAVAIMKGAGVDIVSQQIKVSLPLQIGNVEQGHELVTVNGTYDVEIGGAIYDVKSASDWAFKNKFDSGAFSGLQKDDAFGYIDQGFGYAEAAGKRFGGWIAVNKSTGAWAVLETPTDPEEYEQARQTSLGRTRDTVKSLTSGAEFKRCFSEQAETFYRKPTGNKVLDRSCTYCAYKWKCWPELKYIRQPMSKSETKYGYYTYVDPKHEGTE
jgi:hypothetical protein